MEFRVEIEDKIDDDTRLMAEIRFSRGETTISLYFPQVIDGMDRQAVYRITNFLNWVTGIANLEDEFIGKRKLYENPQV
jgi:hypothetical protein